MGAEQAGKGLALGFAQFGELLGHVADRAVVLTDLDVRAGHHELRGVTVDGQRGDQRRGPVFGFDNMGITLFEVCCTVPGEASHRRGSGGGGEELQRRKREVVIGLVEGPSPHCSKAVDPRGPPAATATRGARCRTIGGAFTGLDLASGQQRVQVTADGGAGQSEAGRQCCGGLRAALKQCSGHPICGSTHGGDGGSSGHLLNSLEGFHNTSVANVGAGANSRPTTVHRRRRFASGVADLHFRIVPTAVAVAIDGLVVRYGATIAVDHLTMALPLGGVSAVLGPNGAGKTSAIETCEGYRRPAAGAVRVLGLDPVSDATSLRPRVGVMLQEGGVAPASSAVRALTHVAGFYRQPLPVSEVLERLGLTKVGRTPFRRLSGGEKQRVKLAVALIGRPELVFLDEPTAGLDPQARYAVWDLVEQLRRDGVTVVLTTHLMDEAERLADHVVIVDGGQVVAAGSPAALTGGDADILTFTAPAGLDTSMLQAALPLGTQIAEIRPGSYRIDGVVDPSTVSAVSTWCAQLGVLPRALDTGKRSLEDVFLDLTGKALRE
jgi:ABC-2 type transport system ATP-binding protein